MEFIEDLISRLDELSVSIAIVLFLLLAFVSIYFFRKFKKVKSSAQEEVHKAGQESRMTIERERNMLQKEVEEIKKICEHKIQQNDLKVESAKWKIAELDKIFNDKTHLSERAILQMLHNLFDDGMLDDVTVFYELSFVNSSGLERRIDFFIVTPFGLYVIEAKYWKGSTFIYEKGECPSFLRESLGNLGLGSDLGIRVFNIGEIGENDKTATINTYCDPYANPVAQARMYSRELGQILGVNIFNLVVFATDSNCSVYLNGKALEEVYRLDTFSHLDTLSTFEDTVRKIVSGKYEFIPNTLESQAYVNKVDRLRDLHDVHYRAKLNKENYRFGPTSYIEDGYYRFKFELI